MIKILGLKRVLILAVLLSLNIVMGAVIYMYLMPQRIQKQTDLNILNSQVSTLQSDIDRMQVAFSQLAEQQTRFDNLRERGFFSNQGRRTAEKILASIQKNAGVITAVATIGSGVAEDNEEALKAEYKILKSPITVSVDAMDSIDIFRYIYLLERFFPGHVAIEKIVLKRQAEITGDTLKSISSGESPSLARADIDIIWRTMIPQSDVIITPEQTLQEQ